MKITRAKIVQIETKRDREVERVKKCILAALKPFPRETQIRIVKAAAIMHGIKM